MKRGRKNINEPTHMLMIKFDILKKSNCLISQIRNLEILTILQR
jgi:hypothetical protein